MVPAPHRFPRTIGEPDLYFAPVDVVTFQRPASVLLPRAHDQLTGGRSCLVAVEGGRAALAPGLDSLVDVVGSQGDRLGQRLPLQGQLEPAA
jgi:hypothetical protein